MVNWNDININDYLQRNVVRNPQVRRVVDVAKAFGNDKVNQINEGLDTIYNYARTGSKSAGDKLSQAVRVATKKPSVVLKPIGRKLGTVAKNTPFIGDTILVGQGVGDIMSGHPRVGAGRIAVGGTGLALDAATIAELLATPLTGGASAAGAVATQAGKQAVKKAALNMLEKAIAKGAALNTGKNAMARFVGGEALGLLKKPQSIDENVSEFYNSEQQNQPTKQQAKQQSYSGYNSGGGYTPDGIEDIILRNTGDYNNDTNYQQVVEDSNMQAPLAGQVQQGGNVGDDIDLEELINLYNSRNEQLNPYIENIRRYAGNYGELQNEAYNRDRFLAALSGLSGNPAYQRMMGRYNPAEIEAQTIDLEGKIAEQKQKQTDDLLELIGNATMARQLGLPVSAAMANKNLLNTYTGLGKAQIGLQGKMYGADKSAEAKMYVADRLARAKEFDTRVDNEIKYAIAQGNWSNARQLQEMKNQNRIQTSIITGLPFGDINEIFAGTNALGVTNINTNNIPSANSGDIERWFKK